MRLREWARPAGAGFFCGLFQADTGGGSGGDALGGTPPGGSGEASGGVSGEGGSKGSGGGSGADSGGVGGESSLLSGGAGGSGSGGSGSASGGAEGSGSGAGAGDGGGGAKAPEGGGDSPVTAEALKIPEGQVYDEELAGSYLGIINDSSLSRAELGQKLLDLYAATQGKYVEALTAAQEAEQEAVNALTRQWEKEARNDPEYGGVNFDANLAVILRGRDAIETPGAKEMLVAAKLGSHPEILRMFYRIGKLLGEDGTGAGGAAGAQARDRAEMMFGKSLEGVNLPRN